jgi:nucleotide-binding universal stress UspA family protein
MLAINRILCPVDFSECSRHALDHAVALARWYEAHLTVLHVCAPPLRVPLAGLPGEAPEVPPLDPEAVADDVRRFCGSLPTSPAGPATIAVKYGDPAKAIVQSAAGTDLLVMATHERRGFERLLLGSVTEKVLRTTRVPVLTIPPPADRPESVRYHTILCPVELSGTATRGLAYALSLAEESDARLVLLHVLEGATDEPSFGETVHLGAREFDTYLEGSALSRLQAAVPEDARVWCTPTERVARGKAYRQILHVATEERAELIVMDVHGKGVLHPRLFGSTTPHIIREASCPVLTLRG